MRENPPVAAIPHIHGAFAELTADPRFESLSVALERNQFDSLGTMIKVYLPTAVHTLEQQAEVVNALTDLCREVGARERGSPARRRCDERARGQLAAARRVRSLSPQRR